MINRYLNKNIKINPIEKENLKNGVITKTIPGKFINIVKFWLKKKYNTTLTQDELSQIIFI